jgi:hypothetical protein
MACKIAYRAICCESAAKFVRATGYFEYLNDRSFTAGPFGGAVMTQRYDVALTSTT